LGEGGHHHRRVRAEQRGLVHRAGIEEAAMPAIDMPAEVPRRTVHVTLTGVTTTATTRRSQHAAHRER
jgi:hypothetical protein